MKKLLFYKKPSFWISAVLNITLILWILDLNKKSQQDVHLMIDVLRSDQGSVMTLERETKKVPIHKFTGVLLWFKEAPTGDNSAWTPNYLDNYTIISDSRDEVWVDVPEGSEGFIMKGYFF